MSRKWTIIWFAIVYSLFLATAVLCFSKHHPVLLIFSELVIPVLFATTIWLTDRMTRPFTTMSSSMNMLREGDFSSTLVKTGNQDADTLIHVYNSMILKLREERLTIREKNHFLDLLIESSPMGIIVLDQDDRVLEANKAACQCLDVTSENLKGFHLRDVKSPIAQSISSIEYERKKSEVLSDGRKFLCTKLFFMDHGFKHPFYIIEELTDEIRKAEKEAYEKLIRMMAHEVNNTIGSVNSIMSSIVSNPSSFTGSGKEEMLTALNVAIQRNHQMNKFMQGFSDVVKLPKPEKENMDLNKSVRIVTGSFSPALKSKNATLILSLDPSSPSIFADRSQMEQVLFNIVKNSLEAIAPNGKIQVESKSHPVSITISDDGPGLDEIASGKLFTPFFSTKPGGQGIGLTLTQEILSNHDFRFTFCNNPKGGTVFKILF